MNRTLLLILTLLSSQTGMIHAAEAAQPAAPQEQQQQRDDATQTQCMVCLEEYSEDTTLETRTLSCGHKFHTACIDGWTTSANQNHNTCPFPGCNKVIDPLQTIRDALNALGQRLQMELTDAERQAGEAYRQRLENLLQAYTDHAEEATVQALEAAALQARGALQEIEERNERQRNRLRREHENRNDKLYNSMRCAAAIAGMFTAELFKKTLEVPALAVYIGARLALRNDRFNEIFEVDVVLNNGAFQARTQRFYGNAALHAARDFTDGFFAARTMRRLLDTVLSWRSESTLALANDMKAFWDIVGYRAP